MACKRLEQTSPSVRLRGGKKSDENKNDKVCKAFLKSSKQLITHKGSVTRLRECLYHGKRHLVVMAMPAIPANILET